MFIMNNKKNIFVLIPKKKIKKKLWIMMKNLKEKKLLEYQFQVYIL